MSTENKDLALRVFDEIWNARNVAAVDEVYAADYVSHDPMNPVQGTDGARQTVMKYLTAFPDTQFTIHDIIAEGDKVVTRWTAAGTQSGELEGVPPTGRQVRVEGTTVSRMAGGKITEEWPVWDALGMMRQLGVIPAEAEAAAEGEA